MARIPVRFQRVAEAFDADVARLKLCESSGSEHSPPESFVDLSDLVNSFIEKNYEAGELGEGEEVSGVRRHENHEKDGDDDHQEVEKSDLSDFEKREMLKSLFFGNEVDDEDERDAKEKIKKEVELACDVLGNNYSLPGFKRQLMTRLRENGFDAGLCKSKWEKHGRITAGDYEYIDINYSGKRYIVEVSLSAEFEIARPTTQYSSLLHLFPLIFVGKVEDLKQIVRLMCTAIKGSMKRMNLHIPPWRRNGYMQVKWFGSYKRTTNAVSTRKNSASTESLFANRSIGFEVGHVKWKKCRDDYVSKTGFRIGHLTAVFNSDNFYMQL